MAPDHDKAPSAPLGSRRHQRRRLRSVDTPFGVILDISESGACVFHKGSAKVRVGDGMKLQVRHNGQTLDLDVRVVRTQTLGVSRLEVGVEFLSLDDEKRRALRALAETQDTDYSPSVWLAA